MTRVIANDTLRGMLHDFSLPVEICDESGTVLCRVVPASCQTKFDRWEPEISEEEVQRLIESKSRRYTTAEVLAHLEKL